MGWTVFVSLSPEPCFEEEGLAEWGGGEMVISWASAVAV